MPFPRGTTKPRTKRRPDPIKEKAKALKAAGLIDVKLNKPLTKSQKATVNKLHKQYGQSDIVKDPKSFFKVKLPSKGVANNARDSNIFVKQVGTGKNAKQIAFVPKNGFKAARASEHRITLTGKSAISKTPGGKTIRNRQSESIMLVGSKDVIAELTRLRDIELPRGTYPMVRLGGNRGFPSKLSSGGVRLDYESLLNYMTNWRTDELRLMDSGKYKGKRTRAEALATQHDLITQMYVVTYKQ